MLPPGPALPSPATAPDLASGVVPAICQPHDHDFLLLGAALITKLHSLILSAQGPQLPRAEDLLLCKNYEGTIVGEVGVACLRNRPFFADSENLIPCFHSHHYWKLCSN